jgi:RND family efflux transporter MFP subunit
MKYTMKIAGRPLAAIALALLAWGPASRAETPEAVVELATVTESNSASVLRLPGTVISTNDAEISSELEGRLTWVAEVGQQIGEGQLIAVLDDHLLNLQLRNDFAEISRIEADIDYNRRQVDRLERLAKQNNTAKSELDQVQSRLHMLEQDQHMAEVKRDRTVYDLDRSHIKAPYSGVVASRTRSAGEYTEPGDALVRLVDVSSLEISVNAPLRVARHNEAGVLVQVEGDGRRLMAPVRALVPVGDSRSRMMELRLSLEPGNWFIGEAVTVEIPDSAPEKALSIPRDALVLRDNDIYVYTVSEQNKAVKIPVTPGSGLGTRISVEANLEPGDPVIVRGAERLVEGQTVKVTQHHLAASPPS